MIKKLTFILLIAGCAQGMYAQNTEKSEKFLENKTLFEELRTGNATYPDCHRW